MNRDQAPKAPLSGGLGRSPEMTRGMVRAGRAGRVLVAAAALAGGALLVPFEAGAQGTNPKADVMVIHATDCAAKKVDPAIGEALPLKYNCYALLERKSMTLVKGQPSTTSLPNNRTFQLTHTDTKDGKYKVTAAISKGDGGYNKLADITAEPNKPFTVGGFAHGNGGAIVLTIRIVP